MRRTLLFLMFTLVCATGFAQTPTLREKLYHTCKVWGFAKYYHSEVSTCHVNWDSVLLHVLPMVRSASTSAAFNDALDTMLAAAGPMALSTTYFPDTIAAELKRNRDFSWITSPLFRSDVKVQLDTIKNNFRPHGGCNVGRAPYTRTLYDPWGGWLEFPNDTILLLTNTVTAFPDRDHLMLQLFKTWNIIRYFNPYNYVLDRSWDTTFTSYVLPVDNSLNAYELGTIYMKIGKDLNDAHVYGLVYGYTNLPGYFKPYIRLGYMGGKYVVVKSLETGIYPGDAITSIDGLNMTQWEDSLRPYYSAGNMSVFRRIVCGNLMGKFAAGQTAAMVVEDSNGVNHSFSVTCHDPATNYDFFTKPYYAADSLGTKSWTTLDCNIGYLNIGNLTAAGTDSAYAELKNDSVLIVDVRNYPISNSAFILLDHILPAPNRFAKFTIPDTTYPGTYTWLHSYTGIANPTPYTGRLIILMNEETQSAAEFDCMGLQTFPGAIKIGSQTAGADGNITWFKPSYDMRFGWTSLGAYYENGDSTQRIGIVPDIYAYPTRAGFRHHHDEVLERALVAAGCLPATPPNAQVAGLYGSSALSLYPNPATAELSVRLTGFPGSTVTVTIKDLAGRKIASADFDAIQGIVTGTINISSVAPGMYFADIACGTEHLVKKFVKE